jgi:hypothetical protein
MAGEGNKRQCLCRVPTKPVFPAGVPGWPVTAHVLGGQAHNEKLAIKRSVNLHSNRESNFGSRLTAWPIPHPQRREAGQSSGSRAGEPHPERTLTDFPY